MDAHAAPRNAISDFRPPVVIERPSAHSAPLVFVSAHSGRFYPSCFLSAARLGPLALRRSEDSFVDELFASAPHYGAPLVHATFPRAWCDPNREPWELDPAMFEDPLPAWVNTASARVSAGLGTIARVVSSGETIYCGKLRFSDARARVETCWKPFHDAVSSAIGDTLGSFGFCVLIDCHSMPSQASAGAAAGRGDRVGDMVLGDAHGTSCTQRLTRFVERRLQDLGYRVRRNDPYAGGFITRHYGRPRDHVHALQIEIARHLYMDEATFERSHGFERLRADLNILVQALAAEAPRIGAD